MSHVNTEYDALRNQRNADVKAKAELRRRVHDKIHLAIFGNSINGLNQAINGLTDWVLNLLSSEVISTDIKVLGLTVEQIHKLKNHYEETTGKKPYDI